MKKIKVFQIYKPVTDTTKDRQTKQSKHFKNKTFDLHTSSSSSPSRSPMGLFAHTLAGGGLLLIGFWEVFISSYATLHPPSPPSPHKKTPLLYSIRFLSILIFSVSFIIDSTISLINASQSKDQVGFALQLEIISIISLFLLYSIYGLLFTFTNLFPKPSSILNLIALFGFGQEFLHFYLQRKDPEGLENRYFDMLLVPITACLFTTLLEICGYKSNVPSLGRGVGLIMQGMWFVQMGFSFYTNVMAQGCDLIEKSRGNFTVLCQGDMATHRGKAIVTLQFNVHLVFLVVMSVGVYAFVVYKFGVVGDYSSYKPINAELQEFNHQNGFALDSDDESEMKSMEDHERKSMDDVSEPVARIPVITG